ncbi:MAG: cytochrome c oxidase assembly protein [Candidatus Sulfotelmatobacter sp.]
MTSDAQAILRSWSPPLGVNLALALTLIIYVRGWLRLHAAFPKLFSAWRLAAFLTGIISIWIAIGSPLAAFDDVSLTVHMVQHLLLMAIAPYFMLLGAPTLPLLQGLPQLIARRVIGPLLRWAPLRRFGHLITNPAICWLAATLALIAWHVPTVFEAALRDNWLHDLEHASFLAAGFLFWWPVVQPWPSTARWPRWSVPLYLFAATLPCDALSGFLAFCDRVVYVSYNAAPRLINIPPLEDQQLAASLMWICVTIILLVPAVIVTMQILSPQGSRLAGTKWSEAGELVNRPRSKGKNSPEMTSEPSVAAVP